MDLFNFPIIKRSREPRGPTPPPPLKDSHISATLASLSSAIANTEGKVTNKGSSPHPISFQKRALLPFPKEHKVLEKKDTHSFQISFQTPIPKERLTMQEHQPPRSSPNFELITFLQREPLSLAKHHNHLLNKALLRL